MLSPMPVDVPHNTEDSARKKDSAEEPKVSSKVPSSDDALFGSFEEDTGEKRTPKSQAAKSKSRRKKSLHKKSPVRRENEDDDGYDPFSDYMDQHVPEPLFERDPWK